MIKKRKKFALSLKVLSLLSCIAVLSVGFASWIIIQQPAQQNKAGSITTYTTDTKGMTIETVWVDGENEIIFGRKGATSNTSWLYCDDGVVSEENLTAVLKVTCTVTEVATASVALNLTANTAKADPSDEDKTNAVNAFEDLMESDLIAMPFIKAYSDVGLNDVIGTSKNYKEDLIIDVKALAGAETEAIFYLVVEFGWGDVFQNTNPYVYYNKFHSYDEAGTVVDPYTLVNYKEKDIACLIADAALADLNSTMKNHKISFNLSINGEVTGAA